VCLDRDATCVQCGAPVSAPSATLVVEGRYRLDTEIGRGGMGIVYRAIDVALERAVALKLLAKEQLGVAGGAQRFLAEARALAKVRNDHVAQVYALGEHDDTFYIAMELVRGDDLHRLVLAHEAQGVRVPLHRALTIVRQLAEGLSAMHAAGLVHRDVKPENVVIEASSGRPVLVDFGLALPQRSRASRGKNQIIAGTPAYMAPEQARVRPSGEYVTPRTDVYSLACMAFELVTGRLPFRGLDVEAMLERHASSPAPLPSMIDPALAPFDATFAKALAKSPADRHESVRAFAAELDAAGAQLVAIEPPASQPPVDLAAQSGVASVLIVDDDPVFRKLAAAAVNRAFEGTSVDVNLATSGEEALATAGVRTPHVVLLDYHMPGLDGFETLSRLRNLRGGYRSQVLVLSASLDEAAAVRFRVLGVEEMKQKPVPIAALAELVRELASRQGLLPSEALTTVPLGKK
jgi:serine/threonine-protein kinase